MQEIIVEKPYKFVPPHRGDWIPSLIHKAGLVEAYLKRFEGIHSHEVRRAELLTSSLESGHGVLLAPNHCRYADPIAMGWLSRKVQRHLFSMASWHLFNQGWLLAFAIKMCGGFSVFREGSDRKSLETAIDALADAKRPLVVFPEGTVYRSNDRLQPLLDGVAFLARSAARRREKRDGGQVVIHPVAVKYLFRGDLAATIQPVIERLESRFSLGWSHSAGKNTVRELLPRIERLSLALLGLWEIKHLGQCQQGSEAERRDRLITALLAKQEKRWDISNADGSTIPRIKALRIKMMPELLSKDLQRSRRIEIWNDLEDLYQVQQISSYPADYLAEPTETRILETVERIEEDITDKCTIHQPFHTILEVCEAIIVPAERAPRGQQDPLLSQLSESLFSALKRLSAESPLAS